MAYPIGSVNSAPFNVLTFNGGVYYYVELAGSIASSVSASSTLSPLLGLNSSVTGTVSVTSTLNPVVGFTSSLTAAITQESTLTVLSKLAAMLQIDITTEALLKLLVGLHNSSQISGGISGSFVRYRSVSSSPVLALNITGSILFRKALKALLETGCTVYGAAAVFKSFDGQLLFRALTTSNLNSIYSLSGDSSIVLLVDPVSVFYLYKDGIPVEIIDWSSANDISTGDWGTAGDIKTISWEDQDPVSVNITTLDR